LFRFSFGRQRDAATERLERAVFEQKLKNNIDQQVMLAEAYIDSMAESEEPIYDEAPINPETQTGASKLLGGEMRLSAKWYQPSED
jgi:VIT1/CCC1 family predicted Fe2+/Mn2+ transporter